MEPFFCLIVLERIFEFSGSNMLDLYLQIGRKVQLSQIRPRQ